MVATVAVLVIAATVAQGSARAGSIPPYPEATRLCSGHVTGAPGPRGAGPHIEWTAFYSPDAPDTVVAWYEGRLASGFHRREGRQDIWRIPSDQPTAVLTVSAPVDAGPLTGCPERPPATARTMLVLSTMTRPEAPTAAPPQATVRPAFAPELD